MQSHFEVLKSNMQPFYTAVLRTPSEKYRLYLIRETFLRYKTNNLCLAKQSVLQKNAVRLLNKTEEMKMQC